MTKLLDINDIQRIETEMIREVDRICTKHNITYYLVCGSVLGAVRHKGPIPWDFDVDITVPLPQLDRFIRIMQKELEDGKYGITIPGDESDVNNLTTFPRIYLKKYNPRKIHVDVFPQIGITSDEKEQKIFTQKIMQVKLDYKNKLLARTNNGNFLKVLIKKTYLKFKTRKINATEKLNEFNELCNKYSYENSEFVTNPCGHYGIKNILPKSFFGEPKRIEYLDMMLPVPEKTEEYLKHYYKDYMKYPPQEIIDKMMKYTIKEEK